jgi:hypothetical protein
MILWYSTAGTAVMSGAAADSILDRARRGVSLPAPRRIIWIHAQRLAHRICTAHRTNPVDWLTGGCGDIPTAWNKLDDMPGIGPKIASFIMREFSFLRDYSPGTGGRRIAWRRVRDREWFDALSLETQALFVPVDNNVFAGARRYKISSLFNRYDVRDIYASSDLHQQAAMAITMWSRHREFDPRDVDVYWYRYERGYIERDGRPVRG